MSTEDMTPVEAYEKLRECFEAGTDEDSDELKHAKRVIGSLVYRDAAEERKPIDAKELGEIMAGSFKEALKVETFAPKEKPTWGQLYTVAQYAVKEAHKAANDLAGWSGASGNWPLQDAEVILRYCLQIFDRKDYAQMVLLPLESLKDLEAILKWVKEGAPHGSEFSFMADAEKILELLKGKG